MNRQPRGAHYIQDAARQRLLMEPRLRDRAAQAQGERVYYAVDTDIVNLFTAPAGMAVRRGNRPGYTTLFHDDKPETAIAVARTLAHYLFFRLQPNMPMLVIPPHHEELQRVYDTVTRKVDDEHAGATSEAGEIKRLLEEFRRSRMTYDVLVRELENNAGTLLGFLFSSQDSPSAELRLYARLLEAKRLATPDYLLKHSETRPEGLLPGALTVPASTEEREAFHARRNDWFRRLLDDGRKQENDPREQEGRRALTILDDAEALTRLEWINGRLPKGTRVALITGSHIIATALERADADGLLYRNDLIRHPMAFLADPEVFDESTAAPKDDGAANVFSKLREWVGVAFGEDEQVVGEHLQRLHQLVVEKDHQKLADLARALEESRSAAFTDLRIKWDEYTRRLTVQQITSSSIGELARKNVRSLLKLLQQEGIQERVRQESMKTWIQFLIPAVGWGAGLLDSEDLLPKLPKRGMPCLRLHNRPKAQRFADCILVGSDADRPFLGEISDEDPSGYTYFIVGGLFFASRGRWEICSILARRALEIADYENIIAGHEAAFLLAVALRHHSSSVQDLKPAGDYLAEARERLRREGKQQDIRFDSERCALNLTYHLYRLFMGTPIPEGQDTPSLDECLVDLKKLHDSLAERETDARVRPHVELQLLTNLFMVAFLLRFKEGEPLDVEQLAPYALRLQEMLTPGKNEYSRDLATVPATTFHVKSINLAAQWLVSRDDDKRKQLAAQLQQHLLDANIKANKVLPYDERRFTFLRDIVGQQSPM